MSYKPLSRSAVYGLDYRSRSMTHRLKTGKGAHELANQLFQIAKKNQFVAIASSSLLCFENIVLLAERELKIGQGDTLRIKQNYVNSGTNYLQFPNLKIDKLSAETCEVTEESPEYPSVLFKMSRSVSVEIQYGFGFPEKKQLSGYAACWLQNLSDHQDGTDFIDKCLSMTTTDETIQSTINELYSARKLQQLKRQLIYGCFDKWHKKLNK